MTEPDDVTHELIDELMRRIAHLNRWATRKARFDVPHAQARVLALVEELGPAGVTTLARADHSSQPTLTGQVDRLAAAGWVRRSPDPHDARSTLITITPEGSAVLSGVRRARADRVAALLDGLAPADRARLAGCAEVLGRLDALARSRQD